MHRNIQTKHANTRKWWYIHGNTGTSQKYMQIHGNTSTCIEIRGNAPKCMQITYIHVNTRKYTKYMCPHGHLDKNTIPFPTSGSGIQRILVETNAETRCRKAFRMITSTSFLRKWRPDDVGAGRKSYRPVGNCSVRSEIVSIASGDTNSEASLGHLFICPDQESDV